jgi:hypothetical protein
VRRVFAYCKNCGQYSTENYDTREEIAKQIDEDGGDLETDFCPVCEMNGHFRID